MLLNFVEKPQDELSTFPGAKFVDISIVAVSRSMHCDHI